MHKFKQTAALSAVALGSTLSGTPSQSPLNVTPSQSTLSGKPSQSTLYRGAFYSDTAKTFTIRVSQESAPGAGDFDEHILGTITALQTTGKAADFYMYGKKGPSYGNSQPVLTMNTAQIFFVNASDGLALFVVYSASGNSGSGNDGAAKAKFELSGGKAKLLLDDDSEVTVQESGRVFVSDNGWAQNTDGMVVGPLLTGFTLQGQFTEPPTNLAGGWTAISADGTKVPLTLVPGQRVRLDVE